MTAYTVTAGNLYFYQELIVEADDIDSAFDKFETFLAHANQQAEEEEEYQMGQEYFRDGGLVGSPPQRQDYAYRFHDADVVEFVFNSTWNGTPTPEVQVMGSGGNG